MTLPLIYALKQSSSSEKRRIINIIKKDSENPKKVTEVIDFVHQSGGLKYAQDVMVRYQQEAYDLLDTFPDNEARESIRTLIKYVAERKK